MGLEIKLVMVKHELTCSLCYLIIPKGNAYRIRWTVPVDEPSKGRVRGMIGYYHVERCGPAMITEIQVREKQWQVPPKSGDTPPETS